MTKYKMIMALITCFVCQGAYASSTTWDFSNRNNTPGDGVITFSGSGIAGNDGNTGSMVVDDIKLTVTAWSDTSDTTGQDTVESATVWNNSYGLLNYNRNESDSSGSGDHYVDSRRDGSDNDGDVDMLLFTFSKAVSLTKIWFGSAFDGGNNTQADISIAAFSNMPTLAGETWSTIAASSKYMTSLANLAENAGNAVLGASNGSSLSLEEGSGKAVESKYWLIGAYSSVFGEIGSNHCCGGNDGFKFKGLTTHYVPPTDANAPATVALIAMCVAGIWYRRKRS